MEFIPGSCKAYEPMELSYDLNALEPYINEETMRVHYDVLYKRYVANLNLALSQNSEYYCYSLEELILGTPYLPDSIARAVFNNAGGVFNHEFFFNCMRPVSENAAIENRPAINSNFNIALDGAYGGYNNWKEVFTLLAMDVFGSGWTWLCADPNGQLEILNTVNQVTPYTSNLYPLLCIDIWEHAYFLQYEAARQQYIENWFNLINWNFVEENYQQVLDTIAL